MVGIVLLLRSCFSLPEWAISIAAILFASCSFLQTLVFYVAIAAVVADIFSCATPTQNASWPWLLLFSFSTLLAFRIILRTLPMNYPIYYSGPALFFFSVPFFPWPFGRLATTSLGRIRLKSDQCRLPLRRGFLRFSDWSY